MQSEASDLRDAIWPPRFFRHIQKPEIFAVNLEASDLCWQPFLVPRFAFCAEIFAVHSEAKPEISTGCYLGAQLFGRHLGAELISLLRLLFGRRDCFGELGSLHFGCYLSEISS